MLRGQVGIGEMLPKEPPTSGHTLDPTGSHWPLRSCSTSSTMIFHPKPWPQLYTGAPPSHLGAHWPFHPSHIPCQTCFSHWEPISPIFHSGIQATESADSSLPDTKPPSLLVLFLSVPTDITLDKATVIQTAVVSSCPTLAAEVAFQNTNLVMLLPSLRPCKGAPWLFG